MKIKIVFDKAMPLIEGYFDIPPQHLILLSVLVAVLFFAIQHFLGGLIEDSTE